MTPAWPAVAAALATALPTLDGWTDVRIYDGPPVTGAAPREWCAVGWTSTDDVGGSFEQPRADERLVPGLAEERGVVRCELVLASGRADTAAPRVRAFALLASLAGWIDEDPSLAAALGDSGVAQLRADLLPEQTSAGALVRLVIAVDYLARP